MLILGLDPGLGTTGWGMIRADGNRLTHVANGQIRTDASMVLPRRLALLHGAIVEVIRAHRPEGAAVEEVLGNSNAQSTLKLGQARGMALLAAAQAELVIGEYHPSVVKKAVVGTGGAEKKQVQAMVARLLPGVTLAGADAADALAVAITHAHHVATARRLIPSRPSLAQAGPMIARLAGALVETSADAAVLDVGGVGYLVQASARTLAALPQTGGHVILFTEMQVREDAITLFGFGSAGERDWFRLLTSVQGVGGRVALAILSVLEPGELTRAIAAGDKAMVARANGVGPKLAQRIVMELKDKAGAPGLGGALTSAPAPKGSAADDALSALANLGFRPAEAARAVEAAVEELGDGASLDALVRLALRKAAR